VRPEDCYLFSASTDANAHSYSRSDLDFDQPSPLQSTEP